MENKKKSIECYWAIIDDGTQTDADFLGLVSAPAIETDFVAFNDGTSTVDRFKFKILDAEKRMLAGPIMIPNKPLLRRVATDENKEIDLSKPETYKEYYLMFSEESIENAAKKFNKGGYNKNTNIEHSISTNGGAYVFQNWMIEDGSNDNSNKYGFSLPYKTWFGIVYVEDENIWNDYVKTGKIKGFSIEAMLRIGDLAGTVQIEQMKAPDKLLIEKRLKEIEQEILSGKFKL